MKKYSELLADIKKYYSELKPVRCFALDRNLVYFTRSGFNHLLWKNQSSRPMVDQIRRFKLLKYVSEVISNSKDITNHRTMGDLEYWTLSSICNGKKVKVVVRKGSRGPLHFYSVMN